MWEKHIATTMYTILVYLFIPVFANIRTSEMHPAYD